MAERKIHKQIPKKFYVMCGLGLSDVAAMTLDGTHVTCKSCLRSLERERRFARAAKANATRGRDG